MNKTKNKVNLKDTNKRIDNLEYKVNKISKLISITSLGSLLEDDLFEEAWRAVTDFERVSASLLQRRLSIGYARAARLVDQLEREGVVGPQVGSMPRVVLKKYDFKKFKFEDNEGIFKKTIKRILLNIIVFFTEVRKKI